MDAPAGPVVSETMIESRLKDHITMTHISVAGVFDDITTELNRSIDHHIQQAYLKGLSDGFAQRVFADNEVMKVERA